MDLVTDHSDTGLVAKVVSCANCFDLIPNLVSIQYSQCCLEPLCSQCYPEWHSGGCRCNTTVASSDSTGSSQAVFIDHLFELIAKLEVALTYLIDKFNHVRAGLSENLNHHYANVATISDQITAVSAPGPDQPSTNLTIQLTTQSQALTKTIQLQIEANQGQVKLLNNKLNYLAVSKLKLSGQTNPPDLIAIFNTVESMTKQLQLQYGFVLAGASVNLPNCDPVGLLKTEFTYQALFLFRHRLAWSIQTTSVEARLNFKADQITNLITRQRYRGLAKKIFDLIKEVTTSGYSCSFKFSFLVRPPVTPPGSVSYWLLFESQLTFYLVNQKGDLISHGNGVVAINHKWLIDHRLDYAGEATIYRLSTLTDLGPASTRSNMITVVKDNLGFCGEPDRNHMVLDQDLLYVQTNRKWWCYDLAKWSNKQLSIVSCLKFINQLKPSLASDSEGAYYKILYVKANILVLETVANPVIVTFDVETGQELHRASINPGFINYEVQTILEDDSMILCKGSGLVLYRFGPYGVYSVTAIKPVEPYYGLNVLADGTIVKLAQDGDDYWVEMY